MAGSKGIGSGASNAPIIPYERRGQLLGMLIMAIAFSLFLALISYSPQDTFKIGTRTFNEAFELNSPMDNWLGLLGAYIAEALIPNFLGLPVLIFPVLLFAWGWLFLRKRPSLYLPIYTTYGILGAIEFSILFGWFEVTFNGFETPLLYGAAGYAMADSIARALGSIGSLFAILISMLITLILLIDRDLDDTIARIEEITGAFWELMSSFGKFLWEYMGYSFSFLNRKAKLKPDDDMLKALSAKNKDDAEKPALAEKASPSNGDMSIDQFQKAYANKGGNGVSAEVADVQPSGGQGSPSWNELLRQQLNAPPSAQTLPPPVPLPQASQEGEAATNKVDMDVNTRTSTTGQVELKVQQQIQEETTDRIANSAANVPLEEIRYRYPSVELLEKQENQITIDYAELEENKQILLDALSTYNIEITDINAIVGPTITMYELTPAPGIKISKIKSLEDDLAMAMAAQGIRMVAPIPGKSAIGVEIPNRHREIVRLRDLIATKRFRDNKMRLPLPLGKTIEGQVSIHDIASMPHLLIAGATGSGKSVALNALITSLLYACHPSNLKFVMIDPKKIELQQYSRIVDHYLAVPPESETPIITDVTQALGVLRSCEREMDFRYNLLQKAMVRGLHEYNLKFRNGELDPEEGHRHFPYLVVVVDELADLMLTAGKEIEAPIARLAQMARAVGIHLVLATQRPSVDVITGLIKANFPARVAFQVASKVDSRTILDQNGAEGLVGNGDMLYMKGSHMTRLQGPFVSVDEVDLITNYIADQPGPGPYYLPAFDDTPQLTVQTSKSNEQDSLFAEAARIIVESQQGSVSLLQRKLSVGYTRAARIVDQLEQAGIVGPFEGSKARQVLVPDEPSLQEHLRSL